MDTLNPQKKAETHWTQNAVSKLS